MSGKKSKKEKKAKKERKKEKKAKKGRPAPKPAPKAGEGAAKAQAAKPSTAAPSAQASAAPPAKAAKAGRKPSRRSSLSQRRGPHGELLAPGDLLLPGGPKSGEEVQYLFRGAVAAEHPAGEEGVGEVIIKRGSADPDGERSELTRHMRSILDRFERGGIEPLLPNRPARRGTFQGVVERARARRREIGAFLRGLDLGRTETSHMDSHGEASLQSLMEWAARLENLVEADEPDQADYNQFHRGLDQLENTTEALIMDVEQTLRRLRDRVRTR